jgi:hypothetical protein
MSVCRSRGRPRLAWIRKSGSRRPGWCPSQPINERPSGRNARAESAATARITRFSPAVHIAAPLVMDAVVTGHDKNEIGLLIFLQVGACRAWLGADLDPETLVKDQRLLDWIQARLTEYNRAHTGSSSTISCFRLQVDPPQPERFEITDKGYINQRAVIAARAHEIELLHQSVHHRL